MRRGFTTKSLEASAAACQGKLFWRKCFTRLSSTVLFVANSKIPLLILYYLTLIIIGFSVNANHLFFNTLQCQRQRLFQVTSMDSSLNIYLKCFLVDVSCLSKLQLNRVVGGTLLLRLHLLRHSVVKNVDLVLDSSYQYTV